MPGTGATSDSDLLATPSPARDTRGAVRSRTTFALTQSDAQQSAPTSGKHDSGTYSLSMISSGASLFRARNARQDGLSSKKSASAASYLATSTTPPAGVKWALRNVTHSKKPKSVVSKKGKHRDHAGAEGLSADETGSSSKVDAPIGRNGHLNAQQLNFKATGSYYEFAMPGGVEQEEMNGMASMPDGRNAERKARPKSRAGSGGKSDPGKSLDPAATALLHEALGGVVDGWSKMPQALQSLLLAGFRLIKAPRVVEQEHRVLQKMYVVLDGTFASTAKKVNG